MPLFDIQEIIEKEEAAASAAVHKLASLLERGRCKLSDATIESKGLAESEAKEVYEAVARTMNVLKQYEMTLDTMKAGYGFTRELGAADGLGTYLDGLCAQVKWDD